MTIRSLEDQARKTVLNFIARLGEGKHRDEELFAETNEKQGNTTNPIGRIWVMDSQGYLHVGRPEYVNTNLLESESKEVRKIAQEHLQKSAEHPQGMFDTYIYPDQECLNGTRTFVKRVLCDHNVTYIVGSGFCL